MCTCTFYTRPYIHITNHQREDWTFVVSPFPWKARTVFLTTRILWRKVNTNPNVFIRWVLFVLRTAKLPRAHDVYRTGLKVVSLGFEIKNSKERNPLQWGLCHVEDGKENTEWLRHQGADWEKFCFHTKVWAYCSLSSLVLCGQHLLSSGSKPCWFCLTLLPQPHSALLKTL